MNITAEKRMRMQAYKYRDGMGNESIAKAVNLKLAMVDMYLKSIDEQIAKGEITKEDIVKSCDVMGIEKVCKKKNDSDKIWIDEASGINEEQVDVAEAFHDAALTNVQLQENAKALDEALAMAGEQNAFRTNQSDFVLSILGYLYDELVSGNIRLARYVMDSSGHELSFEVNK